MLADYSAMSQARLLQLPEKNTGRSELNCVFAGSGLQPAEGPSDRVDRLGFLCGPGRTLTELIGERLADLGLRDCSSYAEFLANGETGCAEMDILIAQLTIGETYFFRDEEQFAAIRDVILPDILERKRPRSSCESGAPVAPPAPSLTRSRSCWRGQMADRMSGWQIDIHATDLNREFSDPGGRRQIPCHGRLRSTSDAVKRECFSKEGLTWTIHPRYKQWISFQHMNLMDSEFSTPFPAGTHFDLILCRNVMIYFSPEMNRRLIGQFHQSLGDGGWLVVGAAESQPGELQGLPQGECRRGQAVSERSAPVPQRSPRSPAVRPVNRMRAGRDPRLDQDH